MIDLVFIERFSAIKTPSRLLDKDIFNIFSSMNPRTIFYARPSISASYSKHIKMVFNILPSRFSNSIQVFNSKLTTIIRVFNAKFFNTINRFLAMCSGIISHLFSFFFATYFISIGTLFLATHFASRVKSTRLFWVFMKIFRSCRKSFTTFCTCFLHFMSHKQRAPFMLHQTCLGSDINSALCW